MRHGLAALARPGSVTLGAVVSLGLGVLTVLGMQLVQWRLSAQLDDYRASLREQVAAMTLPPP